METGEHIAALRREGQLLATAADRSGLSAPIPTCPGWRMRNLLRHMGGVHRWAAAHVADRRIERLNGYSELVGTWPDDLALVDWFRDGHAALVRTLEQADPDLTCWSFLPAPSPLAFWARRQAHETGIHRADAECASGAISSYDVEFARDGIDELLLAFLPRPSTRFRAETPRTFQVHSTDTAGKWLVRVGPDSVDVTTSAEESADCTVSGPAADLYLLLWNRRSADGLRVEGDRSLLDQWRAGVQVSWGADADLPP
jgi:uncharacterized protein (TIGR03083 family)